MDVPKEMFGRAERFLTASRPSVSLFPVVIRWKNGILMKLLSQFAVAVCAAALFAAPASACCLFPFGGWWGAGYYGMPAYSAPGPAYSTNYAPYYGPWGSPSYVASYGSSYGNGCCAPSCCDPCGSCGTGCASGSCAGTVPAGTLKPAQDPISDKANKSYEDEPPVRRFESDPRDRSRTRDDLTTDPLTTDPLLEDPDQIDQFRSPGTGTGTGTETAPKSNPGFFDETPTENRLNQKPAIPDPLKDELLQPADPEPAKPLDEKTFFDGGTFEPDNSAARTREAVLARTSSLSEVITPKRLASRSMPSAVKTTSSSKLANTVNNDKSGVKPPMRWISAPLPEGNVRL